jgi:EAL domain-containing protein (putative c-di-GMP-specific phosphodiesterase class I)
VKGCDSDPDMMRIIEASVGLGRAFKMKVVAEGIDSPQVLAKLEDVGCDIGQGFLFAPSLRADRVQDWMELHATRVDSSALLLATKANSLARAFAPATSTFGLQR